MSSRTVPNQSRDPKRFRRDIQGLRAFGLVVMFACHAEFGWGSGGFVGLDIFFVISGFLITGLILDEMRRTGTLSLAAFYARRVRRLLPLALTVLVFVVLCSSFVYSPLQADRVSGDVIAASLYVVNWRFAEQEVDYFAVDAGDSPIQHFWSLSIEEQFYLVWPLLLLLAFMAAGRRNDHGRLRPALWGAMALIGIPSLVYSALLMDLTTNAAYFATPSRLWEFALGGALALALPAALQLPRVAVAALSWGGVAVLLVTTVEFSRHTPYPGNLALLPTLATAAIVIAGTATTTSLPLRVLCSRPFQYVGDLSYAWYLWHWPVLVFARAAWGALTPVESLAVILASWVPTAITHHAIENRFRYSRAFARRPRRALSFGFACIAAATAMAIGLTAIQPRIDTASSHEVSGAVAAQRGEPLQTKADALRPTPRQAKNDRGRLYDDGCLVRQDGGPESPPCVYGDENGHRTAVLFGDSHAMHYFRALERVATRRGWRLVALTRAACTAADVAYEPRCDEWRAAALRRIERVERPDLVLVGTSTTSPRGVSVEGERLDRERSEAVLEEGYRRTLARVRGSGARVLVLADTPRSPRDVAECVAEHPDRLHECAFPDNRRPEGQFDVRAARAEGVRTVEAARLLCPDGLCRAVIGNALVFRDTNHLSASFVATMDAWFERHLPDLG